MEQCIHFGVLHIDCSFSHYHVTLNRFWCATDSGLSISFTASKTWNGYLSKLITSHFYFYFPLLFPFYRCSFIFSKIRGFWHLYILVLELLRPFVWMGIFILSLNFTEKCQFREISDLEFFLPFWCTFFLSSILFFILKVHTQTDGNFVRARFIHIFHYNKRNQRRKCVERRKKPSQQEFVTCVVFHFSQLIIFGLGIAHKITKSHVKMDGWTDLLLFCFVFFFAL